MDKRAYYAEYPDRGMASIVKIDEDSHEFWTAESPDPDAFIAMLQQKGYEVIASVSSAYENKETGRMRRKWHPIDVNGPGVQAIRKSFANTQTLVKWAKEDAEEPSKPPQFNLDILPAR